MQTFNCPKCKKLFKTNLVGDVVLIDCTNCGQRFHLYASGEIRRLKLKKRSVKKDILIACLGVTGLLAGGFLGAMIGATISSAILARSEFGGHILAGFIIGAPVGGLVGCVLGVVTGIRLVRKWK